MHITKVIIKNYRCLANSTIVLDKNLNIIVGNNECGKSTLLEAIHLALTGLLNGRPIQGKLHPFLFNAAAVSSYIKQLLAKVASPPPTSLIELYFADEKDLAALKGTNNSTKDNVPGVTMRIEFNDEYRLSTRPIHRQSHRVHRHGHFSAIAIDNLLQVPRQRIVPFWLTSSMMKMAG